MDLIVIKLTICILVLNSIHCIVDLDDQYLIDLKQNRARLGNNVQFVCDFLNVNETIKNIIWIKENSGVITINGEIKLNKNKYATSFEQHGNKSVHTLTISNLDLNDQSKYICQQFDLSIVQYFDLIVLVPPSDPIITYTINNHFSHLDDYEQINLKENDNLDLKCFLKTKGNPVPHVQWLKNGRFFTNQSYLSVSKLNSFDHLDVYTCIVEHEALDEQKLIVSVKLIVYCKYIFSLKVVEENFISKTQYKVSFF